jgi:dephospho-CoA kinase
MKRIGLTGSIGSGKSTVASLLRARGFAVLDADQIARELTGCPEVLSELLTFGPEVVRAGRLDRAALARRVFGDPEALARLNALIHPRVRAELARRREALGAETVFEEVPLLYESGLQGSYDSVIVVDAPLPQRLERLSRRGLPEADARRRDALQLPADTKRALASAVLENTGSLVELEAALDALLLRLQLQPG